MRELYKTKIHGPILHGDVVAACPDCGASTGLTVYGYLGGPARIECPCGHDFPPPAPFDAVRLLEQTATGPGRENVGLAYGPLPDPDHFR